MLCNAWRTALVVAIVIGALSSVSHAQFYPGARFSGPPAGGAISAVGQAVVKRQPSAMRMYVQLVVKGKSMKDALAEMKKRREAAIAKLQDLGADKESVSCDGLSLSTPGSNQRRQMEMMVMSRMGKKPPKGLQVPKLVSLSTTLTAEWPIKEGSAEQLLIFSEALKEKVKAADIAGAKEKPKLTPEEEELAEEMAEMMPGSSGQEIPIGEPHFLYVARITEEDREKAMADAFAKAKANAQQLAKTADIPLGRLLGISGGGSTSTDYDQSGLYSGGMDYERQNYIRQLVAGQQNQEDSKNETLGADPESLGFQFAVYATFALEKK